MAKRYAGRLEEWTKITVDGIHHDKTLPKNLGYVVRGQLGVDHKERHFDFKPVQTSLVVHEGDGYVETLNSIYELGQQRT